MQVFFRQQLAVFKLEWMPTPVGFLLETTSAEAVGGAEEARAIRQRVLLVGGIECLKNRKFWGLLDDLRPVVRSGAHVFDEEFQRRAVQKRRVAVREADVHADGFGGTEMVAFTAARAGGAAVMPELEVLWGEGDTAPFRGHVRDGAPAGVVFFNEFDVEGGRIGVSFRSKAQQVMALWIDPFARRGVGVPAVQPVDCIMDGVAMDFQAAFDI